MRVIAGFYKGVNLFGLEGHWLRPTSDRVRESIFSSLYDAIIGTKVLDLFAGTGSFGIEALSRGAAEATFVDQSPKAAQCIAKNLQKVKCHGRIFRMTEFAFIKMAAMNNYVYDIIFCDPPYEYQNFLSLLNEIKDAQLVAPFGYLIYESSSRTECPEINFLKIVKEKKFGDTKITFFKINENNE
jgi:16S rRNA (guanine966-N2)-methyltransferase